VAALAAHQRLAATRSAACARARLGSIVICMARLSAVDRNGSPRQEPSTTLAIVGTPLALDRRR
jgi:deoxycytidylate deaminase